MAKRKLQSHSKHTPAPWFFLQYANFGKLQTSKYYEEDDDLLDLEDHDRAEANGHLASAAPDMLKCLEEIMDLTKGDSGFSEATFNRIRKAIKKAKNE